VRLALSLEYRFCTSPDGAGWAGAMYPYEVWTRYLDVFDSVLLVARALPVAEPPSGWCQATGLSVQLHPLPHYVGLAQYLLRRRATIKSLQSAVRLADAFIARTPSPIASLFLPLLDDRPYGVEVVGDPREVFAPGGVRHRLRPLLRRRLASELARQVSKAAAALYVTDKSLQARYPCSEMMIGGASNVMLDGDDFVPAPRATRAEAGALRLLTVGTLEQLYKGIDVLIEAVGLCTSRGMDVRLDIVGDGRRRLELEELSSRLDLARRVAFRGEVGTEEIGRLLDRADIFVLASRTEGLPRAMVEAMARAVPCVGSTAGGIPELLSAEDLVAPNDAVGLAAKLAEVAGDADRLQRMSQRNLDRAQDFRLPLLRSKRRTFYREVARATQEWQDRRHGHEAAG
jgi:glycosyltransferase involved in cell wall biosynthesis